MNHRLKIKNICRDILKETNHGGDLCDKTFEMVVLGRYHQNFLSEDALNYYESLIYWIRNKGCKMPEILHLHIGNEHFAEGFKDEKPE